MYSVLVEGLEFYGYHGVSPEERSVGHRFRVDLSVTVNKSLPVSDEVSDTVDYGELAQVVVDVGTKNQFLTVERLVAMIGENVMNTFPKVESVNIQVEKLLPPIAHTAKAAGVQAILVRGETK